MSKASILAGFKTDFQAGISTVKNTTIDDTGFLALPQGTTAQRVGIASTQGMMRYNTTLSKFEGWTYPAESWSSLGGGAAGGGNARQAPGGCCQEAARETRYGQRSPTAPACSHET